jgi:hypothetical protein
VSLNPGLLGLKVHNGDQCTKRPTDLSEKIHNLGDVSFIGQGLKYSEGKYKVSCKIYKCYQKRNFGVVEIDPNVSLVSPETLVEKSEVSVEFSERNASVVKTQNFELLGAYLNVRCQFLKKLLLAKIDNAVSKTDIQEFTFGFFEQCTKFYLYCAPMYSVLNLVEETISSSIQQYSTFGKAVGDVKPKRSLYFSSRPNMEFVYRKKNQSKKHSQ